MGLEIGADDYIVQPVDNLELVTRVKVMLRIKHLIDGAGSAGDSGMLLSHEMLHDLRSPLNSIMGMAELIQQPFYGGINEKQKEFAQIILKNSERLLDMFNELEASVEIRK